MNEVDFGDSCDSVPLRNDGEVGGHKGEVSNTTGGGWIAVGVASSDDDREDDEGDSTLEQTEWSRRQGLRQATLQRPGVEMDFFLTLVFDDYQVGAIV